jgi:hypothetical protein
MIADELYYQEILLLQRIPSLLPPVDLYMGKQQGRDEANFPRLNEEFVRRFQC